MKWGIAILIVANLLMFAWWYPEAPQPQGKTALPAISPDVEPLVLLSERGTGEAEEQPAQQAEPTPDATETPKPDEQTALAPPAVASGESDAQPEPAVPDETTMAAVESPEPAASDSPESPPSEAATEPEPPPGPAPEPEPVRVCLTIGPYSEEVAAQTLSNRLVEQGVEADIRESLIQEPSGYWVYLPAMPRVEANRIVEDLSYKGIEDYFVGKQNYISLGIFSDKQSAERRRQEIESLGYDPLLEPRFKNSTVYWVDAAGDDTDMPTEDQWSQWLESKEGVRRQSVQCE